jgi:hypothetical protein
LPLPLSPKMAISCVTIRSDFIFGKQLRDGCRRAASPEPTGIGDRLRANQPSHVETPRAWRRGIRSPRLCCPLRPPQVVRADMSKWWNDAVVIGATFTATVA